MKIIYTIEADYYEDASQIKIISQAKDMYLTITEVKSQIRNRIKHQNPSEEEENFLEELQETLYQIDLD